MTIVRYNSENYCSCKNDKDNCIDFFKSYKNVMNKLMPQTEIVADKFHVIK